MIITQSFRNIRTWAALLIAVAAFAACSSDDNLTPDEQQPAEAKTYTLTVQATKDGENAAVKAATRALSLDGNTLNATWAEGEAVTVYNETKKAALTGSLTAQSSGSSTTLKGTLTGTIENGDELTLKFLSPSYSTQDGTLEYIASHCDYAEATVTVSDASTPSVTTTAASFTNQQAIVKFTLKNKADGTTPVRVTSLSVNADGSTYTVTPAYVRDALYVAIPAISSKTVTLTASDGISSYSYEKSGITFENGKYYSINVKMTNTTDYLTVPLTFEAKVAGAVVSFSSTMDTPPSIEYSLNGGAWEEYSSAITLSHVGDKVSFRGDNAAYASRYDKYSSFSCTKDCHLYGNIMSLISQDGFASATSLTESYTFCKIFYNNTHICDHASKTMKLPATTLASYCYYGMFYGCTSLTTAPEFPATTLTPYCYYYMFYNCTNLTNAPELSSTTLANSCYYSMFGKCTSLTTAPELPATTLTPNCYESMFYGCTSLTTAPELPATTLATYCYANMFLGCTSLTTAPALPATTLQPECYQQMFYGCTSLTTAPILPATTLKTQCYYCMFYECSSLNNVTCLATDISASNCTGYWLYKVAASGTFHKASTMSSWTLNSTSGVPSGWTVVDYKGSGTCEDPYLIYSLADWNAFAAKVNDGSEPYAHAKQMANISGVSTAVGSSSHPFKGTYDGQGYTISNVAISGTSSVGLFGYVNDASAVIKNVVVASGTVHGTSQNVGSIVGQLNTGTIQYCANYATVSSDVESARCGGIVGWMRSNGGSNNVVANNINFGNVTAPSYSGGIVGSLGGGSVTNCQNYGTITASSSSSGSAGGITGWRINNATINIANNHNGGNINSKVSGYKHLIGNDNQGYSYPNNTYLTSLTLTVGSNSYTGSSLSSYANGATGVASNPVGITIGSVTYTGP